MPVAVCLLKAEETQPIQYTQMQYADARTVNGNLNYKLASMHIHKARRSRKGARPFQPKPPSRSLQRSERLGGFGRSCKVYAGTPVAAAAVACVGLPHCLNFRNPMNW